MVDLKLMRLMRLGRCPAGIISSKILKEESILLEGKSFIGGSTLHKILKDLSQNFGCKNSDQNQNHGHLPRSLKIFQECPTCPSSLHFLRNPRAGRTIGNSKGRESGAIAHQAL
jgi:hypothetical protein